MASVLPGGGWRAYEYGHGPDDQDSDVELVLAWLVTSAADLIPVTLDANRHLGTFDAADRFLPPDL
ncbi:hypothetical protein [Nocardia sp. NPDC050406]|uniref:hypothetical protein n=1 Tax=Nocardia sp. NPDC050406 TaxID=3364318 RepID=UPI0037997C26